MSWEYHWQWWVRMLELPPEPVKSFVVKAGTPEHAQIEAMERKLKARLVEMRLRNTGITVKRGEHG